MRQRDIHQTFTDEEIMLIRDALGTERANLLSGIKGKELSIRARSRIDLLTDLLAEFKESIFTKR